METKTTGQIICEHRKKMGFTQRSLAEKLNVTDKAVSKWERDVARPDINTIPKLAELIDVPVETLLDIPLRPKEETASACNEELPPTGGSEMETQMPAASDCAFYKERVRQLLKKGLIGFLAGAIFVLITSIWDHSSFSLPMALSVGLFSAGALYGWELLTRITMGLVVVGSFPVMFIVSLVKFVGAFMIGWFVYPVVLLYNLARAEEKGTKKRTVYMGLFITLTALIVIFVLWTMSM